MVILDALCIDTPVHRYIGLVVAPGFQVQKPP